MPTNIGDKKINRLTVEEIYLIATSGGGVSFFVNCCYYNFQREIAKAQLSKPVTERIQILREKKLLEKEEIEQHQKRIVERMSKMDEYIQQHYERRNKQLEKDNKQVMFLYGILNVV